jgi:hypothetical protein
MIDPDATIVIDSFTMSGWMSQWFHARFPGQILDAGPLAPVATALAWRSVLNLRGPENKSCL